MKYNSDIIQPVIILNFKFVWNKLFVRFRLKFLSGHNKKIKRSAPLKKLLCIRCIAQWTLRMKQVCCLWSMLIRVEVNKFWKGSCNWLVKIVGYFHVNVFQIWKEITFHITFGNLLENIYHSVCLSIKYDANSNCVVVQ